MRTLDIAVCDDDISTLELISSSIAAAFGKKGVATQMDTFFSAGSLRRRMSFYSPIISRTTLSAIFTEPTRMSILKISSPT